MPSAPAPFAPNPLRRTLLRAAAWSPVALAGASVRAQSAPARPLPAYAAWKDPGVMIVHSANTIEMRRGPVAQVAITPLTTLYVRNNLAPPSESIVTAADAWVVKVSGVKKPASFTVAELKKMESATLCAVLQCSGNGRSFFPEKPRGTPWNTGAAGNLFWRGVRVRDLVASTGGILPGMKFLTGTGGEELPAGIDVKSRVERSVPVELHADSLLAWEVNGQPIPLAHGGPLRLVVPGVTGVNSVKYVKEVAFTAAESDSAIQQTDYRITPVGLPAMRPGDPSVWGMPPKSWINSPVVGKSAGRGVSIEGVAFSGGQGVRAVDVSIDNGATWQRAELIGADLGPYAWRQFRLVRDLPAGTHKLMSRMVDKRGTQQARDRVPNLSGYLNASYLDHAVTLEVA